MTGYGQFCAVARALDVLGERWALPVVRELLLGASTFTETRRGLPRIPRATLSARLRAPRADAKPFIPRRGSETVNQPDSRSGRRRSRRSAYG